ncbi:hypothetical protein [Paracoccus sp. 22332]|uniref:hypothetical protein n=1 Tax=Paracoccus sp. 22332 TaxID=3453913 RepID=UPI003F8529FD
MIDQKRRRRQPATTPAQRTGKINIMLGKCGDWYLTERPSPVSFHQKADRA